MEKKIVIGDLNLSLSLEYDTESGDILVRDIMHQFVKAKQETYKTSRLLNSTEIKYSLLTLGINNPVAQVLPIDTEIKLIFQNKVYNVKTHTITKGRIGLAKFFKDYPLKEGTLVNISYTPATKEMTLDIMEKQDLENAAISHYVQSLLK